MNVAVIIPTCERPASLARAVASLGDAKIFISHDDAGRFGPAKTRNRGARKAIAAGAKILVFMDDDCIAASDCVEKLIAAFENSGVIAAAGAVIYRADGYVAGANERAVQNPNAKWFMGALCAVRAKDFLAVGGFPENFRVYEDKALALALAMRGRIAHIPAARVYHEASFWTPEMRVRHTDHLTYWPRLAERNNLWSDPADPPPLFWRHILLPRDFGSIIKNFFNAHGQMLLRQRITLWRVQIKQISKTRNLPKLLIF